MSGTGLQLRVKMKVLFGAAMLRQYIPNTFACAATLPARSNVCTDHHRIIEYINLILFYIIKKWTNVDTRGELPETLPWVHASSSKIVQCSVCSLHPCSVCLKPNCTCRPKDGMEAVAATSTAGAGAGEPAAQRHGHQGDTGTDATATSGVDDVIDALRAVSLATVESSAPNPSATPTARATPVPAAKATQPQQPPQPPASAHGVADGDLLLVPTNGEDETDLNVAAVVNAVITLAAHASTSDIVSQITPSAATRATPQLDTRHPEQLSNSELRANFKTVLGLKQPIINKKTRSLQEKKYARVREALHACPNGRASPAAHILMLRRCMVALALVYTHARACSPVGTQLVFGWVG